MISLIYVSRSLINSSDRGSVIDDILMVSIARNTALDVTGLLIASPGYFAQLLEGPEMSVAAVMSSITADPRHTDSRIVRRIEVEAARCPHWRMARLDCTNFGNAIVDPLLQAALAGTDDNAIRRLERLFEAIARDPAIIRSLSFGDGTL